MCCSLHVAVDVCISCYFLHLLSAKMSRMRTMKCARMMALVPVVGVVVVCVVVVVEVVVVEVVVVAVVIFPMKQTQAHNCGPH